MKKGTKMSKWVLTEAADFTQLLSDDYNTNSDGTRSQNYYIGWIWPNYCIWLRMNTNKNTPQSYTQHPGDMQKDSACYICGYKNSLTTGLTHLRF